MDHSEMMDKLDDLINAIRYRTDALVNAASDASKQWEALERMGGKRDDHAFALIMTQIRPELSALAMFATTCVQQIDSACQTVPA